MKYYVVSESELFDLVCTAQEYEADDDFADAYAQAKAACHARPVLGHNDSIGLWIDENKFNEMMIAEERAFGPKGET